MGATSSRVAPEDKPDKSSSTISGNSAGSSSRGLGPPETAGTGRAVLILWDIESTSVPDGVPVSECIRYITDAFATLPQRRPCEFKIALTVKNLQKLIGAQLPDIPGDVDVLVVPDKDQQQPGDSKAHDIDSQLIRAGNIFCDYMMDKLGTVVMIGGNSEMWQFMRHVSRDRGFRVEWLYPDERDSTGKYKKTAQVMLNPYNSWSWQCGWNEFITSRAYASAASSRLAWGLRSPGLLSAPGSPKRPMSPMEPLTTLSKQSTLRRCQTKIPLPPSPSMMRPTTPRTPHNTSKDEVGSHVCIKIKAPGVIPNKPGFTAMLARCLARYDGYVGSQEVPCRKEDVKLDVLLVVAQFKNNRQAQNIIDHMDGRDFGGYNLSVEHLHVYE